MLVRDACVNAARPGSCWMRQALAAVLHHVRRNAALFRAASAPRPDAHSWSKCAAGDSAPHTPRSIFRRTNMRGACLKGTDLRGVDLSAVDGLTTAQLEQAIVDRHTTLPFGLTA